MSATRACPDPRRRPGRPPHRDDRGISLMELVVTIGILGVVMAMVVPMVLTFNRLSMSAQWRSETNTALRPLVDDLFAELRSARSLPTCAGGSNGVPVQTANVGTGGSAVCLRPIDNGAGVLRVATPTQLCFLSQRRSLSAGSGANAVLTAPAYTCVQVGGSANDQFQVVSYPPSTSGYALGGLSSTGTPTTRTLGQIQANATPFSYFAADGSVTSTLSQIALVAFDARVSRYDGVKTDTQQFSYRVALRPQSYRQGA